MDRFLTMLDKLIGFLRRYIERFIQLPWGGLVAVEEF